MKPFIALALLAAVCAASAAPQWQRANLQDWELTTGGYRKCDYATLGGYTFSMKSQAQCAQVLEVDEESGQFRKPAF